MKHSRLPLITMILVLVFFYLPIIVLVANLVIMVAYNRLLEGQAKKKLG